MQLFPAAAPLEFVALDILGHLLTTKRGKRFLLVITYRFPKLVNNSPLTSISVGTVAKSFVGNRVLTSGPLKWLLLDSGS